MGKLKEANPLKFYIAKYFFLALGLLQWTVSATLYYTLESTPKNNSVAFLFLCFGSLFLVLFFFLQSNMKRVAVGKNKIVVIIGKNKTIRVDWPEVKSIRLIPVFNLYKLELKSENRPIYFFPYKNIEPAYDLIAQDTTKMGDIVSKRKKELGI